jgi:N6-adenosine-specific RNA methylase IME4
MCEPVIVACNGKPKHHPLPGLFKGVRREHSLKPETFFEIINERCPRLLNRVELFAREFRPGWRAWGAEKTKFDLEEAPCL